MIDLKELNIRLNQSFNNAEKSGDADSYTKLAEIFGEFEAQARECIQDITREEISEIIQKLKAGKEITKEELKFIRLWIVGDAEYYVKLENNFYDWLSELRRIMNEINAISKL
jgi:predicted Zn-dependent peptidase